VLCKKAMSVADGSAAVRTASYGKMNSPRVVDQCAVSGWIVALAIPAGAGIA
jgi:hypothetical protein